MKRINHTLFTSFAILALCGLSALTEDLAAQQAPPTPRLPAAPSPQSSTTTPQTPATPTAQPESGTTRSRELADQLRRSRSSTSQRTQPRRTQEGRQGLLTMNLTGLETFGDALGSTVVGSADSFTKIETVTLGTGMFVNSSAAANGLFTANVASPSGGAPFTISSTRSGGFVTGNYSLAIGGVPSMLTADVAGYLGRYGGGAGYDISASAELLAYAAEYGIDPSQLFLNADQSRVNFSYPASGNYSHATNFQGGQIVYDYHAVYDIPLQSGGGGMYGLGRQKISENMTPLPTDRFIFDYSYFHGVPLSYRKMGVNRFTPGIEKTFFNKRFSVEMRLPFATTIDNDMRSDNSTSMNVLQLGDMTVVLKWLLHRSEYGALTVGLGISAPLADDLRLWDGETGQELIRWNNRTCHLMPYVGLLLLPGDRTFFQAFFQVDAAAHGDPTHVVDVADPNGGMIRIGKTYDRTFAYTSIALGYWLKRHYGRNGQIRRGMNLMGELHWTQSLDRTDGVSYEQEGHVFNIGRARGNYSVLNMTLGSRFILNEKTSIGVGYALPLSNGDQKQFDGEFRLTCNRYF